MAQLPIPYGSVVNDPNTANDISNRTAWQRTQDNFTDLYSRISRIVSAGEERFASGASTEARIALADAACVAELGDILFIPAYMLPYDITLCPATPGVRRVREGGDYSVYDVQAYGASGLGVTTDSPAFTTGLAAAGAASGVCFVPDPVVGYLITETHLVPVDTTLRGVSKGGTRIIHGFNGDMFNLAVGARVESLYLDGNGAAFPTGAGLWFGVGNGKQEISSCKVIDFGSYCVDYSHEAAGSQSKFISCELRQLDGTSVGQEAVIIRGTATALANPRTFIDCQTEGKRFINLGKGNNVYVVACRIGDVLWDDDCRGVVFAGGRFQGSVGMVIKGANHALSANDIGPQVTLGAGCTQTTLKGNTYNNLPIIDLAVSPTNVIEDQKDVNQSVTTGFVAFAAGDTTPDVSQGRDFQCSNVSTTTITYFDGGVNGQRITVRLDANTAITHNNSFIRLAGGQSIAVGTQSSNGFIRFVRFNSIWWEEGRSSGLLNSVGDLDTTLFINGGFRQTIDGWNQDNVIASQTNVELTRANGRFRAVRAGSVTGLIVTSSEARTAGTLTVDVFKNTGLAGAAGSSLGFTAILDGTNTSRKASGQVKDADAFAAGDEIYAVVTTDAGWLPVTADIRVAIEIED